MTPQDDLEQQLWDYIYGLLEPAEARALEERITSEHDVARAYAETRQRADMLGAAARVMTPAMKWPAPSADEASAPLVAPPAARSGLQRGLVWFLSSAALVLIGLVGYTSWRHTWTRDPQALAKAEQDLASEYYRVILSGPAEVQPTLDNLYTVQLQDLNGIAAAQTDFSYALVDANGEVALQQRSVTDTDGNGVIAVDGTAVAQQASLKVWCDATGVDAPAELAIKQAEPRFATYLNCNKTAYRPGETMYIRSVTLSLDGTKTPHEVPLHYDFQSPQTGLRAMTTAGVTEQGVGNGKVTLSDDLQEGYYQLSATLAERNEPATSMAFNVQAHDRFLALLPDPITAVNETAAQLSAEAATRWHFWPEGGSLVAGLDNKVYFVANEPDGTPAQLRGTIVDSQQQKVAEIATSAAGCGEFRINPKANEVYSFAPDTSGITDARAKTTLPPVNDNAFAKLSTISSIIEPAAALEMEVVTAKAPAQLLVAASLAGTNVSQQFVEFDAGTSCPATQRVSLPLANEIAGPLSVTLYNCEQAPPAAIARESVYRKPARYLKLTLAEPASGNAWTVRVVDEQDRPCEAVLGVNVVAESTGAPAPAATLFANWYKLPAGGDADSQVAGYGFASEGEQLGIEGSQANSLNRRWRLPNLQASTDGLSLAMKRSGVSQTTLGDHDFLAASATTPPLLQDNLHLVEAAYHDAVSQWRDAQQHRLQSFAMTICIGSALLLLAVAMMATLRLIDRVVWLPSLGVPAVTFALGCVWLGMQVQQPIQIAARPIKTYDGAPIVLGQTVPGETATRHDFGNVQQQQPDATANQPHAPTPAPTAEDSPATHQLSDRPAAPMVAGTHARSPVVFNTVPTELYFGGTMGRFGGGLAGGFGGGGGVGGLGESTTYTNGSFHLLDRLATNDYYSVDMDYDDHLSSLAEQSSLAKIALNYREYTPLPVNRYSASERVAQPAPTGKPRDEEAIFWDPLVTTNPRGEAVLNFTLPESGRFHVTIDAHGSERIGSLYRVITRTPPAAIPAPAEAP